MNYRNRFLLALFAMVVSWSLAVFTTPPFDFDEAFYRRIAEEMRSSGEYLLPTYNFLPDSNKPPTYPWVLIASSHVIDDAGVGISPIASRIPSFLATLFTIAAICWGWARLKKQRATLLLPALLYGLTLLPTVGAGAVLLDPLLTLFLSAPLVFLLLKKSDIGFEPLSIWQSVLVGAGLAAATWIKGPVGIVLPGFVVVLSVIADLLLSKKKRDEKVTAVFGAIKNIFPAFFIGAVLSIGFYWYLYINGGKQFVEEFFWTHNVSRGLKPMEGHSGSVFYHIAVVLMGGLPLSALVLKRIALRLGNKETSLWNFPLAWAVGTILLFTFAATKLPNYTWPVWPALCFAVAEWFTLEEEERFATQNTFASVFSRGLDILAAALPLVVGLLFIVLSFIERLLPFLKIDERARVVVDSMGTVPVSFKAALWCVGLCFLGIAFFVSRFSWREKSFDSVLKMVWLNTVITGVIGVGILPTVTRSMTEPLVRMGERAKESNVNLFAVVGFTSPTVSSAYGKNNLKVFGRDDASFAKTHSNALVLTPVWNLKFCEYNGFKVLEQDKYLVLCQSL